jgi:hypothetical protein
MPAPYSAGEPPSLNRNGPLIFLDMDAAVLYGLARVGDLDQPACGGIGISEGAGFDEFVHARTSKLSLHQRTGDLDFNGRIRGHDSAMKQKIDLLFELREEARLFEDGLSAKWLGQALDAISAHKQKR